MSLHRLTEGCEWHDTPLADPPAPEKDGRAFEWRAECDCGFIGPWRGNRDTHKAAEAARVDYRAHAEEALGAEAYYPANVACRNCGSEHEQPVVIGTHVTSAVCVRCGTQMLQPSNPAWGEMREALRGWRF